MDSSKRRWSAAAAVADAASTGSDSGSGSSLSALWSSIMTRSTSNIPLLTSNGHTYTKVDSQVEAEDMDHQEDDQQGEFTNMCNPQSSGKNIIEALRSLGIPSVQQLQSIETAEPQETHDKYLEIQNLRLELEARRLDMEERRLALEGKRLRMCETIERNWLELETKRLQIFEKVEVTRLSISNRRLELEESRHYIQKEQEDRRLALAEKLLVVEEKRAALESSTNVNSSCQPAASTLTVEPSSSIIPKTATPAVTSPAFKEEPAVLKTKKKLVIFHSYCWQNSVSQIKNDFESNRIDKDAYENAVGQAGMLDPRTVRDWLDAAGHDTWLDVRKLDGGRQLYDQLCEAIAQSSLVVAFISDDYARSENCKKEWFYARGAVALPVIPVIVGTPPEPGQKPYWRLSPIGFDMCNVLYIDAQTGTLEQIKQHIIRAVQNQLSKLEQLEQISLNPEQLPESVEALLLSGDDVEMLKRWFHHKESLLKGSGLQALLKADDYDKKTSLHTASQLRRINCLSFILDTVAANTTSSSDLEAMLMTKEATGATAFHLACSAGHFNVVEALIRFATDVAKMPSNKLTQTRNNSLQTPLHAAAGFNRSEIVHRLLQLGADPNAVDELHLTPLHMCAGSKDRIGSARVLLCFKYSDTHPPLDVRVGDWNGRTALIVALEGENILIVEQILDYIEEKGQPHINAVLTASEGSALSHAVKANNDMLTKRIFSLMEIDIGRRDTVNHLCRQLEKVAYNGSIDIVKILLAALAPVEYLDLRGPLYLTATNGHLEIVKLLMEAGASFADHLLDSAAMKYPAIIAYFVAIGAKIFENNPDWRVNLRLANSHRNADTLSILLKAGIVAKESFDFASYYAAGGLADDLHCLLTGDPTLLHSFRGELRDTPLIHKNVRGHFPNTSTVAVLRNHGADIWVVHDGKTPMYNLIHCKHASEEIKVLIAKELLVSGIEESFLIEAIEIAAANGCEEILNLLMPYVPEDLASLGLFKAAIRARKPIWLEQLLSRNSHISSLELTELLFDFLSDRGPNPERNEMVKVLLVRGADVALPLNGSTCLHQAWQNPEVVETILELKPHLSLEAITDEKNRTLLHTICSQTINNVSSANKVVPKLLSIATGKAMIHMKDLDRNTPIQVLVGSNTFSKHCLDVFRCLVEHGADIYAVDSNGWNMFLTAAYFGSIELAEYLLAQFSAKGASCVRDQVTRVTLRLSSVVHLAVEKGYSEFLEWLFPAVKKWDIVFDLNQKTAWDRTPLLVAIEKAPSNSQIVRTLLANGADPSVGDVYGTTPLHFAVKAGPKAAVTVDLLLRANVNINARDRFGQTALHLAAEYGSLEVIQRLTQHGANVALDNNEQTPFSNLHDFNVDVYLNKFTFLLKHTQQSKMNERVWISLLRDALNPNAPSVLPLILKHLPENISLEYCLTGDGGSTPLMVAAENGNAEHVKLLLAHGASTEYDNWPHALCKGGLLEELKNVGDEAWLTFDSNGDTPFDLACLGGHYAILDSYNEKFSIEQFIPHSRQGRLIRKLIVEGSVDGFRWLHSHDANIFESDYEGRSLLLSVILARRANLDKIIAALIDMGADVLESHDGDDLAILEAACDKKCFPLFELVLVDDTLVSRLRGLNSRARLLPMIARLGREDLLEKLLELFPEIPLDATDQQGNTALHWICSPKLSPDSQRKMSTILLARGADFNVRNIEGQAPISIGIVDTLLDGGASLDITCNKGRNPLHGIVSTDEMKIVLRNDEDIDKLLAQRDVDGKTPIHSIFENLATDECKSPRSLLFELEEAKWGLNSRDSNGQTPLFYFLKRLESVNSIWKNNFTDTLIRSKAIKVDLADDNGWTVLHLLCLHRVLDEKAKVEMVDFLRIERGVSLNVYDNEGQTLLERIKSADYKQLCHYFEMHLKHSDSIVV